jgi:hypothetical protein
MAGAPALPPMGLVASAGASNTHTHTPPPPPSPPPLHRALTTTSAGGTHLFWKYTRPSLKVKLHTCSSTRWRRAAGWSAAARATAQATLARGPRGRLGPQALQQRQQPARGASSARPASLHPPCRPRQRAARCACCRPAGTAARGGVGPLPPVRPQQGAVQGRRRAPGSAARGCRWRLTSNRPGPFLSSVPDSSVGSCPSTCVAAAGQLRRQEGGLGGLSGATACSPSPPRPNTRARRRGTAGILCTAGGQVVSPRRLRRCPQAKLALLAAAAGGAGASRGPLARQQACGR